MSRDTERTARWREAHPDYGKEYMQHWYPRGDTSRPIGLPSLSPEQVRAIRRRLNSGTRRHALAVEYGVSYNTIRRIDDGVTYLEQEYQI